MKRNTFKYLVAIFIFLFAFLSLKIFFQNNNNNAYDLSNNLDDDLLNVKTPKIALDGPNGKPLLIKQYANISNSQNYFNINSGENVSFNLVSDWTSKNVTINYKGIGQKKDIVYNGGFDSNKSGWVFKTNNDSQYAEGAYNPNGGPSGTGDGCLVLEVTGATKNQGDYGYYEQNITLQEELYPLEAYFSIDYYYSFWKVPDNCSLFMAVIMDNVNRNKTLNLNDIANDREWFTMSLEYNPVAYGQILPGQVTIRVGLWTNELSTSTSADLRLDNIEYELWTKPNQTGIINAYDHEFAQNHTYYNTSFGEGYSFIDTERTRTISDEIIFTIYSNISNLLDFTIDEITITSSGVKEFNSTISSKIGCLYILGDIICWQAEFSLFVPAYYNSWVEIDKPNDWSFFSIIDGFETDRVEYCIGTGYGSKKLIIPNSILGPGLWHLEAISNNFVSNGTLGVWNSIEFVNTTQLTYGDLYKISITINNSILLSNTQINCSIIYPNSSVFWQDSKEPASHAVSFGNFTVGPNMTVGKYTVKILWVNSQNYSSIDQVGFKEFDFIVWHHSNLTAETSFFEIVVGDPLLAKVKLTDTDVNTSIAFATVRYNSTFEQSGTMLYWGSGIYLADIDTSSLDLGNYYISVNATMDYYQNHSVENLIQVKIISQALVLDVPHSVIEAVANSYAIVQVNVTGAISGAMIWPVNMSTNWQNPYKIIDHNNGTYTLNFSTVDLPSQGIIETFKVSIYANKTSHGETNSYITMTVHPIQTIINVNSSIINVKINEIIDIRLNYTIEESGLLIHWANYSVFWLSLFNLIPDEYGIIVQLNTTNLSIDTYTAVIQAEKMGYETAFKTITIIIDYVDIEVNAINFKDSLEAIAGKTSMIIIKLTDPYTDISIENASVFYSWEFGVGYFKDLYNGTYELEVEIPQNIKGNYMMVLVVAKEGSIYKTTEFSIVIGVDSPKKVDNTIWYILIAFIGVTTVLGIFSLRSYVLLPLKRKRESNLLAKTQKYKDIMNVETIIISNRESGIYLYSKSYNLLKEYQNELLSGFIQAITVISNEIAGKEKLEKISIKSGKYKETEKIIELDFKYFNFFISDFKDLRIVFILKEKASERFKNKTAKFLSGLDLRISDKLKGWDGNLEIFEKNIPPLLEKCFCINYKEKFKFNPEINIPRVIKEGEFNKIVRNLLNVIVFMTRDQEEFYLEDAIRRVHRKNQDKVIEALEVLLERQIIISSLENNR